MVFYFSGTGNSQWVAEVLSEELGDTLMFIPDAIRRDCFSYELAPTEKLGFVFPCYAWGLPRFISDFISRLSIANVTYLYYICTCGDDTGRLNQEFCQLVSSKGWTCHLGYDIMMPESYVNLPGFDVDPHDKETRKLSQAKARLQMAVDDIIDSREGDFQLLPGGFTWIKSVLLRWAFNKWLMSPSKFHVNSQCISCSLCSKVCPMHNIELSGRNPQWGDACVMCMRCYHSCPRKAIEWGGWTKAKGQYLNPNSPVS
ncbi:MAG: EFR1 family ferrodoxin [Bacteroidaceae bacterium]|nr:EFR1 family ferrodoxin [Bacteroidaceae bacterium]